jgi:hypothetical protein
MILHHRFAADEVRLATGLTIEEAEQEVQQRASPESVPNRMATARGFRMLPYPGGRHPRRGFLEGALLPQRETKISIFPPWEDGGYVVVDVPEAIFSNLGLTYLAHTHVPTIWDRSPKPLAKLEWTEAGNSLSVRRDLPNGISFLTTAQFQPEALGRESNCVRFQIELTNGTKELLTGIRVQVCTMLKGAIGFNLQEPLESVRVGSAIAVRGRGTDRWIITSWQPSHRVWENPPVPCIHSDPIFDDCPPSATVKISGYLRFYEGQDIEQAVKIP